MKKILLISATLLLAHAAFSQGTVTFANKGGTSTTAEPGQTVAPVYGLAPDNSRISGNTATGVPMGSTSYGSLPVLANDATHTFTATLWGLDATAVTGVGTDGRNNLVQAVNGSTTFRTSTSGTFAGFWNQPSASAVIGGITSESQRATFQVRVWDTRNGTILTWDQALATAGEIYGYSDLFTVPYRLGATAAGQPNPAPYLQGLQSFNVQVVPEPSVIALGVLGAGCLFLLRRRK
jgi:hypothetical protein